MIPLHTNPMLSAALFVWTQIRQRWAKYTSVNPQKGGSILFTVVWDHVSVWKSTGQHKTYVLTSFRSGLIEQRVDMSDTGWCSSKWRWRDTIKNVIKKLRGWRTGVHWFHPISLTTRVFKGRVQPGDGMMRKGRQGFDRNGYEGSEEQRPSA